MSQCSNTLCFLYKMNEIKHLVWPERATLHLISLQTKTRSESFGQFISCNVSVLVSNLEKGTPNIGCTQGSCQLNQSGGICLRTIPLDVHDGVYCSQAATCHHSCCFFLVVQMTTGISSLFTYSNRFANGIKQETSNSHHDQIILVIFNGDIDAPVSCHWNQFQIVLCSK